MNRGGVASTSEASALLWKSADSACQITRAMQAKQERSHLQKTRLNSCLNSVDNKINSVSSVKSVGDKNQ